MRKLPPLLTAVAVTIVTIAVIIVKTKKSITIVVTKMTTKIISVV